MKIVSGHQPVYLPWLGLIHKASLADTFIFMDDVQYLTQDWNNRNNIKSSQGKAMWLTVPVDLKKSASNLLKDIKIAEHVGDPKKSWNNIHWLSLKSSYGKSPFFSLYSGFFEWLYLEKKWDMLSDLNLAIFKQMLEWFSIKTEIIIGSEQNFTKVKSDLVLEHGEKFKADIVLTGMHGKDYIRVADFDAKGIKVVFQEYKHPQYEQRFGAFVSHLSFVDLLFNHGPQSREICLNQNLTREELCRLISKTL